MVKDPICGMELDEQNAQFYTYWEHAGTSYFCSEHCKKVFDLGPDVDEDEKMNWLQRFIKRIGDSSTKRYGGKTPSCH